MSLFIFICDICNLFITSIETLSFLKQSRISITLLNYQVRANFECVQADTNIDSIFFELAFCKENFTSIIDLIVWSLKKEIVSYCFF